jgi:hypothetical protein
MMLNILQGRRHSPPAKNYLVQNTNKLKVHSWKTLDASDVNAMCNVQHESIAAYRMKIYPSFF